jgi:hypothetical protein
MQSCRKTSHWKFSVNETFSYIIKSNALIDLTSGQLTNINVVPQVINVYDFI